MGCRRAVDRQPLKRLPLCVLLQQASVSTQALKASKKEFVATHDYAQQMWSALNHAVFGGVLKPTKFIIQERKKWTFWGECEGWQESNRWGAHYTKCIRLRRRWPHPKKFIAAMAHEMVHQYEWERQGVMTHGKTFFAWKEKLAEKGITLSIYL